MDIRDITTEGPTNGELAAMLLVFTAALVALAALASTDEYQRGSVAPVECRVECPGETK